MKQAQKSFIFITKDKDETTQQGQTRALANNIEK